ncbi:flagellar basal body P-ring formation chaperone FlgA [Roseivivax isoporae]|uniref:Flagella basal body P-ring formation protein FlgA n=1 Tax=Roseivivax isoporae LMG 25204 TaxID=1449351 RepID=X7FCB0_9RHOB|nr:flagellar basal body P-ring formation chaperone FlgA [Roseivivax isoporae]ETX29689.1 flagellar basal body P-ring biosynthesis protein FlgA [Roseivivax isoporae LMG 25204]
MPRALLPVLLVLSGPLAADVVTPTRTIRAAEIVAADAVALAAGSHPDAAATLGEVIGREARVALFPGRPVLLSQLQRPALVERNALVPLVFEAGGLRITAEGRALGRGAAGERIRVMNLSSKASVFGTVREDGSVEVTP